MGHWALSPVKNSGFGEMEKAKHFFGGYKSISSYKLAELGKDREYVGCWLRDVVLLLLHRVRRAFKPVVFIFRLGKLPSTEDSFIWENFCSLGHRFLIHVDTWMAVKFYSPYQAYIPTSSCLLSCLIRFFLCVRNHVYLVTRSLVYLALYPILPPYHVSSRLEAYITI